MNEENVNRISPNGVPAVDDPVVVNECPTGSTSGTWWVAECGTHTWFKEVSTDAFFAEMHANRHRATYHKEACRD